MSLTATSPGDPPYLERAEQPGGGSRAAAAATTMDPLSACVAVTAKPAEAAAFAEAKDRVKAADAASTATFAAAPATAAAPEVGVTVPPLTDADLAAVCTASDRQSSFRPRGLYATDITGSEWCQVISNKSASRFFAVCERHGSGGSACDGHGMAPLTTPAEHPDSLSVCA